jgi:predicted nucleic acid-binding protein
MTPGPYLLDTNILIEFFSHKAETVALLPKLKKHGSLFTSLLSVAEIRMGWSDTDARVYLPLLYDLFPLQPLTREIAEQAGKWRRDYREKGITLSLVDTVIAAIAYHNNLCLISRNTKHFPQSELHLFAE